MKSIFFTTVFFISIVFLTSCEKQRFTIAKNRVGNITNKTKIKAVADLFKNDSIVVVKNEGVLGNNDLEEAGFIDIFDKKSQNKILRITAKNPTDDESTVKSVTIYDPRFTTKNGTNTNSSFEEIRLQEKIHKTGVTFTKVLLYLDDINAVIHLEKAALKIASYDLKPVNLEQIPSKTTAKNIAVLV